MSDIDRLSEATFGQHHWDDPGMDAFETGYEDFVLGLKVEVRTEGDVWRKGIVIETIHENDRVIVVFCYDKWHDNLNHYYGHGATIPVMMNTKRGILSNIRKEKINASM